MKRYFVFAMFVVVMLGCKKQESAPQPPVEERNLILVTQAYEYEDLDRDERTRTIVDTVDVTGWEKGKNLLFLPRVYDGFTDVSYGFYYPWQGEDSIYYEYRYCYLWVNERLAASTWYMLKDLSVEETRDVASISMFYIVQGEGAEHSVYTLNSRDFERFPDLSLLDMDLYGGDLAYTGKILDAISLFPSNLMLRVEFQNPRMGDIRELIRLDNLKWLWLKFTYPGTESNVALLQLRHARQLKELWVFMDDDSSQISDRTINVLRGQLTCEVNIDCPLIACLGLKKCNEPLRDVVLAYLLLFLPHKLYESAFSTGRMLE